MSDEPEDMMREALENNRRMKLPAKVPTKNDPWAIYRAWVDEQKIRLGLTMLTCQVDEWEEENEYILGNLYAKFPDLYEELVQNAMEDARENARSLRIL